VPTLKHNMFITKTQCGEEPYSYVVRIQRMEYYTHMRVLGWFSKGLEGCLGCLLEDLGGVVWVLEGLG
jgi:hypothetical protein